MSSPATKDIAAARYVASIRSHNKRSYASAYLAFLRAECTQLPNYKHALYGDLSLMAAQAVEMRLAAIWRGEEAIR